ncbi:hypothetical protein PROFUN_01813 [Planoprotostelium fungivorum]|uniref:Protein kinase domain-containing protein n=1 Tax=Planoprotostelium fungivorum TaxID=1890364 RepID=A0A2P6NYQ3_9EUKA|nr:hypothetical protein PROFUN_01813 [Planoprotostelium fungivorum]
MHNYSLTEEIGKGQTSGSVVYKGRKKKTIEYYAIKSVDKLNRDKVLNEVSIMHELSHPNALKFYNWYESPNHLWVIMEYCTGSDLKNVIKQDTKLPECSIQMIAQDLVKGLLYLHSMGIIFCDIKPSNLLFDGGGTLKFADFGHSKRIADLSQEEQPRKNLVNQPWVTPCYMSPELFLDDGVYSFASDLWSLGCILYELAVGTTPFVSSSLQELSSMIAGQQISPVADTSTEFNSLVGGLLNKNPEQRISHEKLLTDEFLNLDLSPDSIQFPQQPHYEQFLQKRKENANTPSIPVIDEIPTLKPTTPPKVQEEADPQIMEEEGYDTTDKFSLGTPSTPRVEPKRHTPSTVDKLSTSEKRRIKSAPAVSNTLNKPTTELKEVSNVRPLTALKRVPSAKITKGVVSSNVNQPPGAPIARSGTNSHLQPPSKNPSVAGSIQRLLYYTSNKTPKPIVEPSVSNVSDLKLPKDKVITMNRPELEAFLTSVYKAIHGQSTPSVKILYLDYFETLCLESKPANLLINSSLLKLFVNMIQKTGSTTLKAKLLHVIGVMVRHASTIPNSARESLLDLLAELVREKDVVLRRSAMSCLGELLFYMATAQQENTETSDETSTLPNSIASALSRCLKNGEDSLVQEYVCQTIDNIALSNGKFLRSFITQEVAYSLFAIFTASKKEPLRVIAGSAFARICRYHPTFLFTILEETDTRIVMEGVKEPDDRMQQSWLNLLNLCLHQGPPSLQAQFIDDDTMTSTVISLLNHSETVIRGKALLTINFLTRVAPLSLLSACEMKVLQMIERVWRDKDTYVRSCIRALVQSVVDLVPVICSRISANIRQLNEAKIRPGGTATIMRLKEDLRYLPIVLHLMTSSIFRGRILNTQLITELSFYLTNIEELNFLTPDELKNTTLLILEAISQNHTILVEHHPDIIMNILPPLVVLMRTNNGDTRFLCLKIFIDMISEFLSNSTIYNPSTPDVIVTRQLNDIITKQLLPNYKHILTDEDPIPPFGLKLLNIILSKNGAMIAVIHRLNLIPYFFKFFKLDHPNNNVHNVRLIRMITESQDIDKQIVYELGIVRRVCVVLDYAYSKSVDFFLEPVLDIMQNLLLHCKDGRNPEYLHYNQPIMEKSPTLIRLLAHPDPLVTEKSCKCLSRLSSLYGASVHPLIIGPTNISQLTSSLSKASPGMQKSLITLLKDIVTTNGTAAQQLRRETDFIRVLRGLRGAKTEEIVNELLSAI